VNKRNPQANGFSFPRGCEQKAMAPGIRVSFFISYKEEGRGGDRL
jgi:hypothetical protein